MIFWQVFTLKAASAYQTLRLTTQRCHIWWAVSWKPPTTGQRYHWHSPPPVSGVNDTAEFLYKVCIVESATAHHWSAVPLWDHVRLRSDPVPDFSECGSGSTQTFTDLPPWWAVSLTPPPTSQQCRCCHWHRWPQKILFESVEYLVDYESIYETALNCGPWAQIELLDEKTRGPKSRDRVPLMLSRRLPDI
jgi:hypothetical protein